MLNIDKKELINRILISVQHFRKNAMTDGKRYMENGLDVDISDEKAEEIFSDLFPYCFGPKSILPVLIKLADREPTNMDVFNILVICNQLDKGCIRTAYLMRYGEDLPEMNIEDLVL